MKIVYVYQQFTDAAGTERILIDKMNYFAERGGYEVIMLTNQQGSHPVVFPLSNKIKRVDLNVCFWYLYKLNVFHRFFKTWLFERSYRKRLFAFINKERPDIVISTTYYFYILSAIAKCPHSFVRIIESHVDKRYLFDVSSNNSKKYAQRINLFFQRKKLKRIVQKFDLLISLNQQDGTDWSRYLKSKVIFNIVHLNPTGNICNQQSKRLIFVGRYVEQKGLPDLYRIWKLIYYRHRDWHLDLYGSGDFISLMLPEDDFDSINFHVHPSESNIFRRYLESSILLLTSIYEPFGLVMPEAMSCGLPVVAFDCPSGPSEIITDGVDGFLIKNRDINVFANTVCTLIESPELRIKMGQAAAKSSVRFSESRIMPEWEALFKALTTSR